MLTWMHLFVVGLAFDVAGAVIVVTSLARTTPESIAANVPLHGSPLGWFDASSIISPTPLPNLARSIARQAAEARLGIVLLAGGFTLQAVAYLFPHPRSGFQTSAQRLSAVAILVLSWIAAALVHKVYVPWSAKRAFERATAL